jgi:RNA-binding protein YlmH
MNYNNSDTEKMLEARATDCLRQSDRGELAMMNFLTPAEQSYLSAFFKQKRAGDRILFFGGYEGAERSRAYLLPEYLSDLGGDLDKLLKEYFPDEFSNSIKAIRIEGSGYKTLTHRDYLGSILALGIERHAIGDIIIENDHSALVLCTDRIFSFLRGGIYRIGADKVTLSEVSLSDGFQVHVELLPMSVTVASERLDCAVGALTNLSREKAQELIRGGFCSLDHLPETRCDKNIEPPCVISVRGHGKFAVRGFGGETRRGRLRLLADKYL